MNFTHLCQLYNVKPDRHGEAHIQCPSCKKMPQRGQVHFSFKEGKGGFCFVCGFACSLQDLADQAGKNKHIVSKRYEKKEKDEPIYNWNTNPERYLKVFTSHKKRYEVWQTYKPLEKTVITEYKLGYGRLPLSRCKHYRLIVPVFRLGEVVDFRGRSISCDCAKWLSTKGMRLKNLTLYNYHKVRKYSTTIIVENPIDALLINQMTDYCGVAIYSTVFWNKDWIDQLRSRDPAQIVVALDNDLGGNGGAKTRQQQIEEWSKANPGTIKVPMAHGPKIVNHLKRYFPTFLYDWKDSAPKMDMGTLLMQQQFYSPFNYTSGSMIQYAYT